MIIKKIILRKIFDSRGEKTLEVELINNKGISFRASVPSGKSRGKKEATVLDLEEILKKSFYKKLQVLENKKFKKVKEFDNFILKLDGTKNKSRLGGNTLLGLSLSFARGLAFEKKVILGELLSREFFNREYKPSLWKPFIFSNLINGGLHSSNSLNIQEYLVIAPLSKDPIIGLKNLINFYKLLGTYLKKVKKIKFLELGDEGGYSLDFKDNFEPISILARLIKKLNFNFEIGLDAAASNFKNKNFYLFERKKISQKDLIDKYLNYFKKVSILKSIEDPFAEDEDENFKILKEKLPPSKLIIGDDLTVTNPYLISKYHSVINAVIIKPNQIGTITETLTSCLFAQNYGLKTIFSHRSGEIEDNFIVELASASNAFGIKIGAPIKERILKYNELLRLI